VSKFPERLKELRVINGISQEELGGKLGYKRSAVSGYEVGRNEPSIDDLIKIADYFNVSLDWLCGRKE
jgi:transcriptional regulator with XRE-family HTH domain